MLPSPRFVLGFALGYVLGAKAGRERYEEIRRLYESFMGRGSGSSADRPL
ncbi:MAG TPA: hypothetical protein VHJ34_02115 [Actinomycetota bacterium]|nr:hypothetical protein [Actinomycetota bacterium]